MVQKLRERSNGEGGFTLVELLVVMLILGLLAAIAIPAFFNQRDKAQDSEAKTSAKTAQTAIETYATDNDGSYAGATDETLLEAIEPTLNEATFEVTTATADEYVIEVQSDRAAAVEFSIDRAPDGTVSYPCSVGAEGRGGCPTSGDWGG